MVITTRRNKWLALLFFFLSYLALCLSVPTNSDIFRSSSRVKRGVDPEYHRLYEELMASTTVGQGDQKFMAFGTEPAALGSDGFAGCIGLVIAGSKGAILAHYADTPDDMSKAKANLPGLIRDNKDSLAGAKARIYGNVRLHKPNEFPAEENIQQIEDIVKDGLNIQPRRVKYIEPTDLLFDKDGNEITENEQEDSMNGFILIQHPGGPSQESVVHYVHLDWQKAGTKID